MFQDLFANFYPDEILGDITQMTHDWLKNRGIKGIIQDMDNTSAETDKCPDSKVISWNEKVRAEGIKTILITHNHRSKHIKDVLNHFHLTNEDIVFSYPYVRPFQRSVKEAIAKFGPDIKASEILVIDDILFGIWPANKLGCYTVLVKPIKLWSERTHPLLLCARAIERWYLFPKLRISFD